MVIHSSAVERAKELNMVIAHNMAVQKLVERLNNYTKASDFLLSTLEKCAEDSTRLPGALLVDYIRLTNGTLLKEIKISEACKTYDDFRDRDILVTGSAEEVRDHCMWAAAWAYAVLVEKGL